MGKVPFYANTSDDTHCVQAAFRIMLKHFLPNREFTYEELDKLTQKAVNKGTWWPPGLINLVKMGLKAQVVEPFDYSKFLQEGKQYALDHFGRQIGQYYLDHSNLLEIKNSIPEFLRLADFKCRPATMKDIDELLADGWLVGLEINARRLYNQTGFVAHMVVIFDRQNDKYFMHDPGLPPRPNLEIGASQLKEIWLGDDPKIAALLAIKS